MSCMSMDACNCLPACLPWVKRPRLYIDCMDAQLDNIHNPHTPHLLTAVLCVGSGEEWDRQCVRLVLIVIQVGLPTFVYTHTHMYLHVCGSDALHVRARHAGVFQSVSQSVNEPIDSMCVSQSVSQSIYYCHITQSLVVPSPIHPSIHPSTTATVSIVCLTSE